MAKSAKSNRSASAVDRRIGARIKERRLARNWSQSALAEAIGVTFQQIQKYERGVNRVAAGTLYAIARTLSLPVVCFFDESEQGHESERAELEALYLRLDKAGRATVLTVARSLETTRGKNPSGKSGKS